MVIYISVFLTKHLKEIMISEIILKEFYGVYQGKGHFQEHDRSVPDYLRAFVENNSNVSIDQHWPLILIEHSRSPRSGL